MESAAKAGSAPSRSALEGYFLLGGRFLRGNRVRRVLESARRGFLKVGFDVRTGFSHGPGEAPSQKGLEAVVGPDVLAVAHGGVKNPALALHPCPS